MLRKGKHTKIYVQKSAYKEGKLEALEMSIISTSIEHRRSIKPFTFNR